MKRLLCVLGLLLWVTVSGVGQEELNATPPVSMSREVMDLFIRGRKFTSDEADAAETKLAKNPDDLDTRFMLLSYYSAHHESLMRVKRCEQVLWTIKNIPDSPRLHYLAEARLQKSDKCFKEGEDLWRKNVEARKSDLNLLRNAIDFFMFNDKALAETLIKQGIAAEPASPEWPRLLARFYSNQMYAAKGDTRRNFARSAYEQLDQSRMLTEDPRRNRMVRIDMMRIALEFDEGKRAQELAIELLTEAPKETAPGFRSDLLHDIHTTLGRAALLRDDVEEAKHQLIAAAAVDGSPVLKSFGPNMALAKELLDKGERDTVLNYLSACAAFWKDPRLQQWIASVSDGRTPDFGVNIRR
jgi:hypothetical protein